MHCAVIPTLNSNFKVKFLTNGFYVKHFTIENAIFPVYQTKSVTFWLMFFLSVVSCISVVFINCNRVHRSKYKHTHTHMHAKLTKQRAHTPKIKTQLISMQYISKTMLYSRSSFIPDHHCRVYLNQRDVRSLFRMLFSSFLLIRKRTKMPLFCQNMKQLSFFENA